MHRLIAELLDRVRARVDAVLDRLDELKWRVQQSEAGSALSFIALLLLVVGGALGFLVADAFGRQDGEPEFTARSFGSVRPDTVAQTVTQSQTVIEGKTVRVITRKGAGHGSEAVSTITSSSTITSGSPTPASQTVVATQTITGLRTVTETRTATVTEVQPVTVTVVETVTVKPGKP